MRSEALSGRMIKKYEVRSYAMNRKKRPGSRKRHGAHMTNTVLKLLACGEFPVGLGIVGDDINNSYIVRVYGNGLRESLF